MGLVAWVGLFVLSSLFWAWVVFWGGADWLEGSWLAAFVIHYGAMEWPAETIRMVAVLLWFSEAVWFTVGLFVKDARWFLA